MPARTSADATNGTSTANYTAGSTPPTNEGPDTWSPYLGDAVRAERGAIEATGDYVRINAHYRT